MSPTRQPPPIQIYQDFPEVPSQPLPQKRPRPQLAPSAMPLQSMPNASQYAYHPSMTQSLSTPPHLSTLKSQFVPAGQNYNPYGMMPQMSMPESTPVYTDSPQKRMLLPSSQPLLPAAPMSQPMFASWNSNYQSFEQENFHMSMPMPDNFVDFPDPSQVRRTYRGPLKRSYSETVPSSDKPWKKGKQTHLHYDEDNESVELPEPEAMPPVTDDGGKPPYSYAQMIGMAILRAPGRKLTLASIYDWISSTFQFYKDDPKTGWHNSIRHNLSLNKAFTKQERPKSDAGKGCYWVIQPGLEAQFFKDKPRKSNSSMSIPPFSSQPTMQAMAQPVAAAIQPQPWVVQSQTLLEPPAPIVPRRPQTAPAIDPALPELSSDATLPASDPALAEDEVVASKEIPELAPSAMLPPPSSPPVINSSPPVVPRAHARNISSPTNVTRNSTKQRRRTQTGMDDSGYFSSLESSARRPQHGGMMPTSELGFVPRKKHGRAEEEIARIRSSSHDITPSGRRSRSAARFDDRSSSPARQAPTTPPVIFKKPQLPPQSISPNTQLQRHREAMRQMIGSPAKADDVFGTDLSAFSPAFKLGTPTVSHSFDDSLFYDFTAPMTPFGSSPIKPMSARAPLQRSNTSAGVLSNITKQANSKLNSKTPSKIPGNITFKAPIAVGYSGSPLKKSAITKQVEFFNDENASSLFDFEPFADENSEEGEELDISKGFSKIGSTNTGSLNFGKTLGSLRPPFARSSTSRF